MSKILESARSDIRGGVKMHRVWVALAREDIGDQHKRTTLGPLWLLINYLLFAGTFIFVFRRGDAGDPDYAPYVATGLLVWFYLMETINNGVSLFAREEGFIKGTVLPLTVYVLRMTMQAVIRTGYAALGCIAIVLLSGTEPHFAWFWAGLAVLLIVLITPAVVTIVAFMGAYFPDTQFILANVMRIGMFLTPVFWVYDGVGGVRSLFYWYNPFTYFLEIVRAPIVEGQAPLYAFAICTTIGVAAWVLALYLLGRLRKQVVFVL